MLDRLIAYRNAGTNSKYKVERWITIEEAQILLDVINTENIQYYYECGTANGFSACWAASAKNVIEVHTWDPVDRAKLYDEFSTLRLKITFHNAKYNEAIGKISHLGKSLFFIDGDHKMRPARSDINHTLKCAKPGDIIVLHDVLGYDWLQGRMNEFLTTHKAELRATKRGMGIIWL